MTGAKQSGQTVSNGVIQDNNHKVDKGRSNKRKHKELQVSQEDMGDGQIVVSQSTQSNPYGRGRPAKKTKLENVLKEIQEQKQGVGEVYTYGDGGDGQLGFGEDIVELIKPKPLQQISQSIQVCCGGMHTVALTLDGSVYTWGVNDEGALGRDTGGDLWKSSKDSVDNEKKLQEQYEPGLVKFPQHTPKIIQVSAGDSHTCALSQNGCVYAWGTYRDSSGVMGFSPTQNIQVTPVLVYKPQSQLQQIRKIVSGSDHVLALTLDGKVYTWGNGQQGQLGRGKTANQLENSDSKLEKLEQYLIPQQINQNKQQIKNIKDIYAGTYSSFIVNNKEQLFSCGLNNYGQLGYKMRGKEVIEHSFRHVNSLKDHIVKQVGAGQHHTLVLNSHGQVYSFGKPTYGRLGIEGVNTNSDEPVNEPRLIETLQNKKIVNVAAGLAVSGCVTSQGEVYSWGFGTTHQLGKSDGDEILPYKLQEGKQFKNIQVIQLVFGGQHAALLGKVNN